MGILLVCAEFLHLLSKGIMGILCAELGGKPWCLISRVWVRIPVVTPAYQNWGGSAFCSTGQARIDDTCSKPTSIWTVKGINPVSALGINGNGL